MTATTAAPKVTEHEAREVAEAARQTEWTEPSFLAELFGGRLRMDLIHPHPEPGAEDEARAKPFLAALEKLLREKVDGDAIDRDGRIPPDVIAALKEIGAFGIKIPREYGGLGLSQLHYTRAIGMVS